jgi:hypothetical protein
MAVLGIGGRYWVLDCGRWQLLFLFPYVCSPLRPLTPTHSLQPSTPTLVVHRKLFIGIIDGVRANGGDGGEDDGWESSVMCAAVLRHISQ